MPNIFKTASQGRYTYSEYLGETCESAILTDPRVKGKQFLLKIHSIVWSNGAFPGDGKHILNGGMEGVIRRQRVDDAGDGSGCGKSCSRCRSVSDGGS